MRDKIAQKRIKINLPEVTEYIQGNDIYQYKLKKFSQNKEPAFDRCHIRVKNFPDKK